MSEKSISSSTQGWAPRFFTIWGGQAFSLLGSAIVQFSLIWWLTETTQSASALTTAALVGLVPQIFIGPLAGALVDRWNRRVVMIVADSIIAAATLLLSFLFAAGVVEVWHIYIMLFVRSAAGGFHWPAMQASTSLMAPNEQLPRIQGLNQLLNGAVGIGGAPLGALLMALIPIQGILWIDVCTALLAILPLFFIAVPQPQPAPASGAASAKPSVWQDFLAGVKYVAAWPGLLIIMCMATIINLVLNPGFALLPILVTRNFSGGAAQLAALESTMGIGMIVGSVLLSVWGGFKRKIMTTMIGLILIGAGSLLVGAAPSWAFSVALIGLFIDGVANPLTNGPLLAVLQTVVAPEMQGRVFTLVQSAATAMMPLGLIVAGPIADRLGVQTWFILGGVITAAMGVAGYFIPAVMEIEQDRRALRASPPSSPTLEAETL